MAVRFRKILLLFGLFTTVAGNCPNVPAVNHGTVSCNRSNRRGSVCSVECEPGYSLSGTEDTSIEIRCRANGLWERLFPKCVEICPSKADIVFVVDFSTSTRGDGRRKMRKMLQQLIKKWEVAEDKINVAAVPFHKDVVEENVVHLSNHTEDKAALLRAIRKLGRPQEGSYTGNALDYVGKVILAKENGNREDVPDIVIVMSDGRGRDDIDDHLSNLWSSGVTTYAIGFHPRHDLEILEHRLLQIAQGDASRMHVTEKKGKEDVSNLMEKLEKIYCVDSVTRCISSLSITPANGSVSCTSYNKIGSTCSFQCDEGFVLVGNPTTDCVVKKERNEWTSKFPSCAPLCYELSVENGEVDCSSGTDIGSVCTIECDAGYFPIGKPEIRCVEEGLGSMWDSPPPACFEPGQDLELWVRTYPERCFPLTPAAPRNGTVICTNGNEIGSKCTFTCDRGFTNLGDESTTCIQRGKEARWIMAEPVCAERCPDTRTLLLTNGEVRCTAQSEIGSSCSFSCNEGYILKGEQYTSCVRGDSKPRWDNSKPSCITRCSAIVPPPVAGGVVCSDGNEVGSRCTFFCDDGFTLEGERNSICVQQANGAAWSKRSPRCVARCLPRSPSPPAHGFAMCSNVNEVGSVCTFMCDFGYSMIGPQKISCDMTRVGATWSAGPPRCVATCYPPRPTLPVNGYITCSDGNELGSICTYACDDGYTVLGPRTTACVARGFGARWSSETPTCVETCRPALLGPYKGSVSCSRGTEIGSFCEFECEDGFSLRGPKFVACIDRGNGPEWNTDSPICVAKCGQSVPRSPEHGDVECSDRNELGSVCMFTCDRRYSMVGNSRIQCVDTEGIVSWNSEPPSCVATCSPTFPDPPVNGDLTCSNGNEMGSICTFLCVDGFFLVGERNAECVADGDGASWNAQTPVCVARCIPVRPLPPQNGNIGCTDRNELGSECTFSCDAGYTLVGFTTTVCEETSVGASWNRETPKCTAKCGRSLPSPPQNGDVQCTDSIELGSICTYTCNNGHTLIGEETSVCVKGRIGARWSSKSPACIAVCGSAIPQPPVNGKVSCSRGFRLGSVCEYQCLNGYSLVGNTGIECAKTDAGAAWTAKPPICVAQCERSLLAEPKYGTVACSNGNEMGSICKFTCNSGYSLIGEDLIMCNKQGLGAVWNFQRPSCIARCKPARPSAPGNGNVECTNRNEMGSVCQFSCNERYEMIGEKRMECIENGDGASWTSTTPTCVARCNAVTMTSLPNGSASCTNQNEIGSICEFECNTGYYLVGGASTECSEMTIGAEWTNPLPQCVARCSLVPTAPKRGYVTCTDANELGSVCTFTCKSGFYTDGANSTECIAIQSGATWNRKFPSCIAKCRPQNAPKNGAMVCTKDNEIDSICNFKCNRVYILNGNQSTSCIEHESGADWSSQAPKCEARCRPIYPRAPTNGMVSCSSRNEVNSVCTFSCKRGFSLVGSSTTTCTERVIGASWDRSTPSCVPTCGDELPAIPEGGNMNCTNKNAIGSICTFSCGEEYSLVGNARMRCIEQNKKASWDSDPPNCVGRCFPAVPPPPDHGSVTCSRGNDVGSICTFRCKLDYSIFGSTKSKCVKQGNKASWDAPPPRCVGDCAPITSIMPENGRVMCTDSNKAGSICTFQCNSRLSVAGDPRTICVDDGVTTQWSNPTPRCVPPCFPPMPAFPKNGAVYCTSRNEVGSMCTFRCNTGFHLVGSLWTICKASGAGSAWDSKSPTCLARCSPQLPISPINGNVSCSNENKIGSACTFACNAGFVMRGPRRTVCEKDGIGATWSNPSPECAPRCASVPTLRPQNGNLVCTNANQVGSVCRFRCNPGYELEGSLRTSCMKVPYGASWNNEAPNCVARCSFIPRVPKNGDILCSNGTDAGSVCTFTCKYGYEMAGRDKIACMKRGRAAKATWTGPAPTCEAKCYPQTPELPNNGSVTCTDVNNIDSLCTFQCDSPLFLVGFARTKCVENENGAAWNRAAPSCIAKCAVLPSIRPQNGNVFCTKANEIGSVCSFECFERFTLVGQSISTCMKAGPLAEWSDEAPVCEPKCFPRIPTAPKRGRVMCNNTNELGSVCTYECNKNYALVGGEATSCIRKEEGPGAEWDKTLALCMPTCIPEIPVSVTNGTVRCSDRNLPGSECEISCGSGFSLVGKNKTTCNEVGGKAAWERIGPKCIENCPMPVNPAYGSVTCTDDNAVGSTCSFTCNTGFTMIGDAEISCMARGQRALWNGKPPTCYGVCTPKTPPPPENGRVICSDENDIDSTCTFQCHPGFAPIGNRTTQCFANESGIFWSDLSIRCEQEKCYPLMDTLENGLVDCSDGNNVGSTCQFKCTTPGFNLYPPSRQTTLCKNTIGTTVNEWSNGPPCCALPCPPSAKMDAVIALDSSSSIGFNNWKIVTKFIENIIKAFRVSEDSSNFAVFRYNKEVDTKSQILLRDFPEDRFGLIKAFRKIPYSGSGTYTGKAIQHILDNILTVSAGNRPDVADVVIVVTDGKAADDLVTPARKLREMGAEVFVIGIVPPRGILDLDQLRELAGDESNIQIVAGGFQQLNFKFARQIASKVCGNPCER